MAKVRSVVCGVCILFSILEIASLPTSDTHYIYDVDSLLPHLDSIDQHSFQLRPKRETVGGGPSELTVAMPSTQQPQTDNRNGSSRQQLNPTKANVNVNANSESSGGNDDTAALPISGGGTNANPPPSIRERPLLGVNGTGQKKDYATFRPPIVSEPINPLLAGKTGDSRLLGVLASGRSIAAATSQVPTATNANADAIQTSTNKEMPIDDSSINIDNVDRDLNQSQDELLKHDITKTEEVYHTFYNSTVTVNKTVIENFWSNLQNLTVSNLLSKSHRRAMTVQLSFDFPFYGHPVRNVTVATGGFLYTGDYVHSWLAATQYIAPLMANFDTSLSNDSFVKYSDNGTSFTVVWENVSLQDRPEVGPFTFSVTLYQNGNIVFAYYSVPIYIEKIHDDKHPVKVGLSDAYIIDKTIFFAKRKTIYEYHRVNFAGQDIKNSTIIYLYAQPTCLPLTDCQSCLTSNDNFKCTWCPNLNRCSTGMDRSRQDWIQKGCDTSLITNTSMCPAIGEKGNNAGQQTSESTLPVADFWNRGSAGNPLAHENNGPTSPSPAVQMLNRGVNGDHKFAMDNEQTNVGTMVSILLPITVMMSVCLWIFYAYRNPHTKSGQLLIQYRPSQWSWRRGEARYTAATIHM